MDTIESVRQLLIAINKIDGIYYLCSRKLGIKYTTLTLLYAISDRKPHTQKEVCDDWLIPKTTLNTIVKDMVKEGYVALMPEEHSHEKVIFLTDKGHEYSEKLVKHFSESELIAIEKTLQKFSPEFIDAFDFFTESLCGELERRILQKK